MTNNVTKTGFVGNSRVEIGRFSYGFEKLNIKQWGEGASLKIGAFCSIASSVSIFLGGNHRIDWITTFPFGHIYQEELGGSEIKGHPETNGNVIIGDDVWIGHGATIMSGISIGSGAVIAANATVVKNVKPYEIVGGNPAKLLKMRFGEEIVNLLLELRWWDLPINVIRDISSSLSSKPDSESLKKLIDRCRGMHGLR